MSDTLFPAGLIIDLSNIGLEMMHHYAYKWGVEREQTEKGLFSTSMTAVHTPNIQLGYTNYSHGVMRKGDLPKGTILLGFVLGKESTVFENSPLSVNELIFLDDGEDMDILSHTKSEMFVVVIEKELFYNAFYNYFEISVQESLKERRLIVKADDLAYFVQGLSDWLSYLKSELFQLTLLKEYNTIETDIINHILSCVELEDVPKKRSKFQVKKIRDLLHDNISNRVTIEQLIEEVDIRGRQFHGAFKSNYGFTPKKYLQNLRLNAVRKELLLADPENTKISDIAFKYDFIHMSHFGETYKKMFGQMPSETLQKK